jgi:hypothetical protein
MGPGDIDRSDWSLDAVKYPRCWEGRPATGSSGAPHTTESKRTGKNSDVALVNVGIVGLEGREIGVDTKLGVWFLALEEELIARIIGNAPRALRAPKPRSRVKVEIFGRLSDGGNFIVILHVPVNSGKVGDNWNPQRL